MLAARARHESEGDTESCPFVHEQLHDAIRVENVPAGQSRARLFAKLLCVADGAKLSLIDSLEVMTGGFSAIFLQAWQAFTLIFNTLARVTAFLVRFSAELQLLRRFNNFIFCQLL